MVPERGSNSRPARTATTRGAGYCATGGGTHAGGRAATPRCACAPSRDGDGSVRAAASRTKPSRRLMFTVFPPSAVIMGPVCRRRQPGPSAQFGLLEQSRIDRMLARVDDDDAFRVLVSGVQQDIQGLG